MATVKKVSTTRWYLADPTHPKGRREARPNTPGAEKVREEGETYFVVYKEGGKTKFVSTGLTDKRAAQQFLADFGRARERGEAGITDPRKGALDRPITEHVRSYLDTLEDRSAAYRRETARVLAHATRGMKSLREFTVAALEKYLQKCPTATTATKYRAYLSGFGNYCCLRHDHLASNPVARVKRRKAGPTEPASKTRRSYTVDELRRLLGTAREYPLASRTQARGGRPRADGTPARPTKPAADLTDEYRAALVSAGKERELVYRLLLATALRRGELSRVTVGMFGKGKITAPVKILKHQPKKLTHVVFHLPPALASELAELVTDTGRGAGDKLVAVPDDANLIKDHVKRLRVAGVEYETEEGFADIHAFRTTGQIFLKSSGVPLHDRQRYLRHAASNITEKHYDPDNKRPATTERPVRDLLTLLDAAITSTTT